MTERKIVTPKPPTAKLKPVFPESLVKPGRSGKIELSEDELKDVSGGCASGKHFEA